MNILGIIASSTLAAAGDFESIATTTVGGGGAATVSFTSIPATYTHLQIRGISRVDAADNARSVFVRFNSDTGSNYAYHLLYGNGSSAAATGSSSETNMTYQLMSAGANATSGIYGAGIIDILDYANTNKYKTIRSLCGVDLNSATTDAQVRLASGLWQNTNAVTSITLTSATSGNFIQYSHFALYGIKGA